MARGPLKKTLIVTIACVGAALALAMARSPGRPEAHANRATPVPVTTADVARQDVPIVVHALGAVQPIESVSVQSRVNGQIMKSFFTPGQDVKAGAPLFLIDPRPYQAALDQTQAQLAHDEATLDQAKSDLARYKPLAAGNFAPKQQAADQAFVVQQDEGTVSLDQANVETARLNVDFCHVNAPIDGRAGAALADPGNYVQAGVGTALVVVTQIAPIYVAFSVPQTDLGQIRQAQAKGDLAVDVASQTGKPLAAGKLTFIDNQVAAATGTIVLKATFPNARRVLWPGEFVDVSLVVGTRNNALVVPQSAVMAGATGDYVYVVSLNGEAHRVAVAVSARPKGIAVIGSGLAVGQTVVTDGQYRLADNVKVVAHKQPPATEPTGT